MAIVNKDELARGVAARSGLDNGQAKKAVEATLEEISKQIADGNEVRLTGFGKFSAVKRAAWLRKASNRNASSAAIRRCRRLSREVLILPRTRTALMR